MTGVHIGLGNWNDAAAAIRSAFEVAPNDPMYAMVYGYALYERQIDQARQDQARREGRDPKSVNPDLSAVDFQQAEQLLRHAIKLNDQLWRAHYYLGRIARDTGRPKLAAEELTKALSREPTAPGPWVALAEIYRQWQRPDLAIATSSIGALIVDDSSDVWFELGMGFDDMRANEKAVDAFTKALDAKADNVKVRFQRGQALVRLKKYRDAKSDLDAVMAAKWPDSDFAKQQAKKMLLDIAAKRGR
jgi:tetratricopeptide (TPR) repeat protein